jgi:hypothetical protein
MEMSKVWTMTTELCEIIIRKNKSLVRGNIDTNTDAQNNKPVGHGIEKMMKLKSGQVSVYAHVNLGEVWKGRRKKQ